MRLVIQEKKDLSGSSFLCFELPQGNDERVIAMMGHKVVEVDDKKGKELLKRMGEAVQLQVDLCLLTYPTATIKPPEVNK